jgi:hypothetical protein
VGFVKVKFLPLVSLALTAPLLLTGCATSPSLEEQTKLIEYEKCMEWNERMYDREIAIMATNEDTYSKYVERNDIGTRLSKLRFENLLQARAKYRP